MSTTPAGEGHIIDGTPIAELARRRDREIEAAESRDNGVRLAMCMEWELLAIADAPVTVGAEGEPEIDWAVVGRVAARVSEDRDELARQLHHLDKHAPRRVYIEAMALVAQHDEFLDSVRDGLREVQS
jgi:hypothetical protein